MAAAAGAVFAGGGGVGGWRLAVQQLSGKRVAVTTAMVVAQKDPCPAQKREASSGGYIDSSRAGRWVDANGQSGWEQYWALLELKLERKLARELELDGGGPMA